MRILTSAGEFGVFGRIHADRRRPALLVVNGLFPRLGSNHALVDAFNGVTVLVVYHPGVWTY